MDTSTIKSPIVSGDALNIGNEGSKTKPQSLKDSFVTELKKS